MVQYHIEAQNLEANVVHVVLGLTGAIIVSYHRLRTDYRFDYELIDLLLDFVYIMSSFAQMLKINQKTYFIDALKTPFVPDVHVF